MWMRGLDQACGTMMTGLGLLAWYKGSMCLRLPHGSAPECKRKGKMVQGDVFLGYPILLTIMEATLVWRLFNGHVV